MQPKKPVSAVKNKVNVRVDSRNYVSVNQPEKPPKKAVLIPAFDPRPTSRALLWRIHNLGCFLVDYGLCKLFREGRPMWSGKKRCTNTRATGTSKAKPPSRGGSGNRTTVFNLFGFVHITDNREHKKSRKVKH